MIKFGIDFKQSLFTEMGRVVVPRSESFKIPDLPDPVTGVRGSDVKVTPDDIIDMRFEDYGVPFGDFSAWQVELPDGRFLICRGMMRFEISVEPGKKEPRVPKEGTAVKELDDDGKIHPWYDFMEVIDGGNKVIKKPLYRKSP